jgi:hypothetical protein
MRDWREEKNRVVNLLQRQSRSRAWKTQRTNEALLSGSTPERSTPERSTPERDDEGDQRIIGEFTTNRAANPGANRSAGVSCGRVPIADFRPIDGKTAAVFAPGSTISKWSGL